MLETSYPVMEHYLIGDRIVNFSAKPFVNVFSKQCMIFDPIQRDSQSFLSICIQY